MRILSPCSLVLLAAAGLQHHGVAQAFVVSPSQQSSAVRPQQSPLFLFGGTATGAAATTATNEVFVNPDMTGIREVACLETAARMKRVNVAVSPDVSSTGEVGLSYVYWPADKKTAGGSSAGGLFNNNNNKSLLPPVVLIHGFDSSCLEYRRLGSKLAAAGVDTYAVDLLGWGWTQLTSTTTDDNNNSSDDISFSAAAKVEALQSFCQTVVEGDSYVLAGSSLGGAAAIQAAAAALKNNNNESPVINGNTNNNNNNKRCAGLVLIDAQGFVDGIGPMSIMPAPVAKLGIGVLKSNPLRSAANQMSYYDKKTYATDDAVLIGRAHTLREGWSDAMVSFMQSGGFSPSQSVSQITAPTLVLWGREDEILDGTEFAHKFLQTLPGQSRLHWVDQCGHVPHLEQPEETATVIREFLQQDVVGGSSGSSSRSASNEVSVSPEPTTTASEQPDLSPTLAAAAAAALGASALAGAYATDLLPFH